MTAGEPLNGTSQSGGGDFLWRDSGALFVAASVNGSDEENMAAHNGTGGGDAGEHFSVLHGNGTYPYDTNMTYEMPDTSIYLFYHILFTFAAPSLFLLILIIGMVGNSLVVYVILSRRGMRTVTNLLLLNLAVADIMFLTITVPFTAYKYVAFSWDFGDIACKIVQYVVYVTAYVTVYTLVAIAALRFLTVVHTASTSKYRTKSNVYGVALLIWLVVLAVNVPTLLSHRVKSFPEYSYCGMEDYAVGPVFFTFFTFAYLLPLLVICLLYLGIMWYLKQQRPTTIVSESSRGRTARACKVIILVVVVFGICWLPLHINSLVAYYGRLPTSHYYEIFRVLWNAMAYGNSCANPIIYSYASKEFRKNFKQIMCCWLCRWGRHGADRPLPSETTTMV